jgi:hypothetical protein
MAERERAPSLVAGGIASEVTGGFTSQPIAPGRVGDAPSASRVLVITGTAAIVANAPQAMAYLAALP